MQSDLSRNTRSGSEPSPPILFLCAGAGLGGMERVVLTLSSEFARRQIPVRVILPDVLDAAQTAAWFTNAGAPTPQISSALAHAFGRRRLSGIPALATLIRRSGASAVNVHYGMNFPSLNDVLAVRLGGARCVASVHSGGGSDPRARSSRARKNRLAASLCSAVVAVSAFQAEHLIQDGIPSHKIRIIPNGVEMPGETVSRSEARMRLGLPEAAFIVGTASRLTSRKGTADLIAALGAEEWNAANANQTLFLTIAGEGPERPHLETMAAERLPGRHRVLGCLQREEMPLLYAACDLFALASYEESFGLVFAEAGLHGVPSIGTRVGGVPETVLHRRTGLLVPPGDVSALRQAIRRLQNDPALRERMGRAAQRRAQSEFSATRMADRYEMLLRPATTDRNRILEECRLPDVPGTSPRPSAPKKSPVL